MNNVVGISSSDLFDSKAHTQGGCPHLMQFLWDEYAKHLRTLLDKRGDAVADLDTLKKRTPATHFVSWAANYLEKNRPVNTFFVESNVGLVLADGKHAAVSPGVEIKGTMQAAQDVPIMEGRDGDTDVAARPGNMRL